MKVSQAIATRKSIRAFKNEPISNQTLADLLTKSARTPSGGNVQPWRIFVINDQAMIRFKQYVLDHPQPEEPAYSIYPTKLTEPYRSSRFLVGEQMYALLGIPREDKPARLRRLAENFQFFGAPAAIFCFVDRQMGLPQWSDLGMFLQSFMLLAKEAGLDTCAQESWAAKPRTVSEFVKAPDELRLFCGVAIGKADQEAPVNDLVSEREPLENFTTFVE
ncbi:MAG: nitroreductase family protein [Gammaproteobacteria bacterium]|nr:nitroreductase family protein [Gammaproteobacteria bacterium]